MKLFLAFLFLVAGLTFRYHIVFVSTALLIYLIIILKKKDYRISAFFKENILNLCLFIIGLIFSCVSIIALHNLNNTVVVIEAKDNYFLVSTGLEKFYVYEKSHPYEVGDWIFIHGDLKPLSSSNIESSFDFKTYLENKGIYSQVINTKIEAQFLNPIRLRAFKNYFLLHFNETTKTLVKAVLFSSIDDNEIVDNFSTIHLLRLLSSSGIYVSLFYKFFLVIFSLFLKEKWAKLISTSFILIYSIFLFPKFSVLRLLLFLILRWINEYLLDKKFSYLSLLGLSGIIFITIDYRLTYQLSFMLGYGFQIFSYFLALTLSRFKKNKRRWLRYLFFFIFIIPIDLYFYHELSIPGYIFSLLLTPLFLAFAFIAFLSLTGIPLYNLVAHYSNGIINITHYLTYIALPIYAPNFSEIIFTIYYLLLFFLLFYIDIKFKLFIKLISFLQIILLCFHLLPLKTMISSEVSFIAVGQGDSTLIRHGNSVVLIDTGGLTNMDLAKESLIPFFKQKQIYNIDLVITTHNDFDHVGALTSLRENFYVKEYIYDPQYFPITINDITFINYNFYQEYYTEENDKSLVIGFNLFYTDFLIMGDASTSIEKRIIKEGKKIPCDILKVGHHGSNTSTSKEWLEFLSPKTAIISCGINNKYHHPHKDVISLLNKKNIEIRRTDLEGTITYLHYFV